MEDSPARMRPYLDSWDNEDKYSVANSQAPLQGAEEDHPERGEWTGKFDFLLSLLGYSVGLGNVWRFPYLCYSNGGGAFLIPFTVMLIIAGLPLMFMELSLGQYASLGPVAAYKRFCPLLRGLGYGMVLVSSIVMLYYNLIIAWTLYYMFASVAGVGVLPWGHCDPAWSTPDCYTPEAAENCARRNTTYYRGNCLNYTQMSSIDLEDNSTTVVRKPPAEEYFNNHVLGLSVGIEETGSIRPALAVCLFLAWVIVFLCLSKGVQSSGKVVYFTALFPYVVLIALFIRGILLPGAKEGILFYLTPDWRRLTSAKVWGDAAVQIFFALSPAWGGLITLSSYNKFTNNCYKDSLIVAVSNIGTSFFAGLVIFSVIGFLANELNVPVASVVDQGAGLAFIVYPEVVARLPVAPLWSLLFFVMLLTLGLDSQFALMETVTTAILDGVPALRNYKFWVVLAAAILGYAGGLIFTTNAGMYWLQLMDKYAANWSVLLIAISECILVAWVYGADRFLDDVEQMIGPRGRCWRFFWTWMWKVITPAALFFILFFNWVEYEPMRLGLYIYPRWADIVGWTVGMLPVFVILAFAINQLDIGSKSSRRRKRGSRHPGYDDDDVYEDDDLDDLDSKGKSKGSRSSIWCRARFLLQPTPEWGPATPSRAQSRTPPPSSRGGAGRSSSGVYESARDTIVLVNGKPMVQPPLYPGGVPGGPAKLPGPSILKNSSKTDLVCASQQV
ncbi:sodium- and chloride-dependent glycine transporter 1 isoform X2 [Athalia rosae]|uniref:sodium- and chloride-dependent glycine transporter 1 isoform X2 n=1 Tax=Athalia rosae TaxID=37344 RepID=UPI00203441C9|nr:sodium- and chloride-dependent glycine transporter 1 isoform X2 [Athalia rosae]